MVADNGICNHHLRNEIEVSVKHLFLFPVVMFNMVKLLAILQVEAGKTMINGLNLSFKILNTKHLYSLKGCNSVLSFQERDGREV